ncbi:MAG: hypothetical protein JW751_16080, partial [Polyangiaceae bacterium]|nr:hypothetical protein [Polyangiaceae bacterium]
MSEPERPDDHGAEAETHLETIAQAIEEASRALAGARRGNEALGVELRRLRREREEGSVVVRRLQAELATAAADAAVAHRTVTDLERERERMLEEQDAFLAAILDENEDALRELQQRFSNAEARVLATEIQRDEALAKAARSREAEQRTEADRAEILRDHARIMEESAALQSAAATLTKDRDQARAELRDLTKERNQARAELRDLAKDRDQARAELRDLAKDRD